MCRGFALPWGYIYLSSSIIIRYSKENSRRTHFGDCLRGSLTGCRFSSCGDLTILFTGKSEGGDSVEEDASDETDDDDEEE